MSAEHNSEYSIVYLHGYGSPEAKMVFQRRPVLQSHLKLQPRDVASVVVLKFFASDCETRSVGQGCQEEAEASPVETVLTLT